jgi:hypothetical protein
MQSIRNILIFIGMIVFIQLAHAEKAVMRPGKWEIKMQVDMAGMPHQMPPMTTTHCVTPEQASKPAKDIIDKMNQAQKSGEDCQVIEHDMSERSAHWVVECSGAQNIKSNGEIFFDSDVAYHGVIKSNIETPQGSMSMTQKVEGRRIGECEP